VNPFTALALGLIRAYQRWVSPYKGFACAHRVHRGGPSCSVVGARVLRRFGLWRGLPVLRLRLRTCGAVHQLHRAQPTHLRPHPRRMFSGLVLRQRGDCDLPCDVGDCDGPGGKKDWLCDCLSCGCDWPDRKKRDERSTRRAGRRALG
jgi:putative component of membrane protein insertase Oxa1/YidC/SpoIIIJ protein YidD